jgi:hypothetical protein
MLAGIIRIIIKNMAVYPEGTQKKEMDTYDD